MKTPASKEAANWEVVRRLLPYGWEQQAKRWGAMRRVRALPSPEMLLRTLLIHLAGGCSLQETAVRIEEAGWGKVSAVALFKRLRASEQWLRWMVQEMRPGLSQVSDGRRLLAVDATVIKESGKSGSLWRVHWAVNLRNLQCEHYQLTDVKGGETLRRYDLRRGDVVLADAGYSSPAAIAGVLERGTELVVRVNPNNLPFYDRQGRRFQLLRELKGLKVGATGEWVVQIATSSPERWSRGRLIAMRRSPQAVKRALRRLRDKARKEQRPITRKSQRLARYVLLWTSLPATEVRATSVLQWYRSRWQIELVFKRMKSIMGLGQLPKHADGSSRAWLHGKLLVALLLERLWQEAEAFSPWGYPVEETPQSLA